VARRLTYSILAVAGLGALFFAWNAWHNSRSLSDADLLRRLPTADAIVLSIDFAQLRGSGLFDKLGASKMMEEADYQAFVRDSGFDYKRDLENVVSAFTQSGTFFVVRGRFDWKKLEAYAKQSGGSCYRDLCNVPGSQPDRHISFLPLAHNVMGLAVAKTDSAAAQLLQPATQVRSISIPAQPIWMSMPGSALLRNARTVPGGSLLASTLTTVDDMMITLGAQGSNFAARMEARCRTTQEAASLTGQLKTLTSLLQATIAREKKKPEPGNLSGVLTAGQFRQADKVVLGEWTIDKSLIDSLLKGTG